MPETQDSQYQSALSGRYASKEMLGLFSNDTRYGLWRRLWAALAKAEMELGLPVTQAQVDQLEQHLDDIDYAAVAEKEREIRHDVMAHVHAYGLKAPLAKGIIHLGATSCYVTDNADILILQRGLLLIREKLVGVLKNLAAFAESYKALPALGYTHLQPAQPVTVGKRATLWMQDLLLDVEELDFTLSSLKLLGSRGTTGTQASFLALFEGDHQKVEALDAKISGHFGLPVFPVSGQTYPRKLDSRVLNLLSSIAQSASKFGNDLRLLQHMREMEEPFEKGQVGSSAMAYKRNPMRSERICSLSRFIISQAQNPALTASTQWLERTLDDSANRRLSISEAFLATDAVLRLMLNVSDGLIVYEKIIGRRLREFMPFMATENILMEAVRRGGDRQALHEKIREHSMEASRRMKEEGADCDLTERLAADPAFGMSLGQLEGLLDPKLYIGRCPEQVEAFLKEEIAPLIAGTDAVQAQIEV
ncbi:MAG: adenylosuccinate lyase [Christensenellaceae bacterium]|jgi:adenylosuccinate lyase|nr:adenylosuccinate lyase [Christensenellaceae bacterium]